MDPSRFDRWTRSLTMHRSRRSTLRGLLALGAATFGFGRIAVPQPVAATGRAGFGCPCSDDSTCVEGLVCCGNSCNTSGNCGLNCTGTGDACPASCSQGEPCADCCGGFCASYGGCTTIYHSQAGGACSLADPTACAPGLTCCPTSGGDSSDGVCQDSCGS
ncbi:MAG: hypothetical protein K0S78_314 [Thermomicrobiales bacterium]|jgi:hypothetical protein|nr:hypothetical protein [Thermomicrobiales bacterium]MDF3041022.1 hypothetical protein [Thermomicrobiales bacterium]